VNASVDWGSDQSQKRSGGPPKQTATSLSIQGPLIELLTIGGHDRQQ